ncbi:hypothetical protein BJ508DRAFT_336494 [Ascobolus immersus RN42]|uniref:Uncharacterized protein n=1 Tax=Ascobolus immersus RN42 TaxID=1160509 RepID=A0A3N4HCH6_ASCIM|nr:hypothetical protein BJ508DRAFT_336494 [Ascobolus immersus RN42]
MPIFRKNKESGSSKTPLTETASIKTTKSTKSLFSLKKKPAPPPVDPSVPSLCPGTLQPFPKSKVKQAPVKTYCFSKDCASSFKLYKWTPTAEGYICSEKKCKIFVCASCHTAHGNVHERMYPQQRWDMEVATRKDMETECFTKSEPYEDYQWVGKKDKVDFTKIWW